MEKGLEKEIYKTFFSLSLQYKKIRIFISTKFISTKKETRTETEYDKRPQKYSKNEQTQTVTKSHSINTNSCQACKLD